MFLSKYPYRDTKQTKTKISMITSQIHCIITWVRCMNIKLRALDLSSRIKASKEEAKEDFWVC